MAAAQREDFQRETIKSSTLREELVASRQHEVDLRGRRQESLDREAVLEAEIESLRVSLREAELKAWCNEDFDEQDHDEDEGGKLKMWVRPVAPAGSGSKTPAETGGAGSDRTSGPEVRAASPPPPPPGMSRGRPLVKAAEPRPKESALKARGADAAGREHYDSASASAGDSQHPATKPQPELVPGLGTPLTEAYRKADNLCIFVEWELFRWRFLIPTWLSDFWSARRSPHSCRHAA